MFPGIISSESDALRLTPLSQNEEGKILHLQLGTHNRLLLSLTLSPENLTRTGSFRPSSST